MSSNNDAVILNPLFDESSSSHRSFIEFAHKLSMISIMNANDYFISDALKSTIANVETDEYSVKLVAAISVLADLARQGWQINVIDGIVNVHRPKIDHRNHDAEKVRIRNQELVIRNEQLREPSITKFISSMENSKHPKLSIRHLIRDRNELASSLRKVRDLPYPERLDELKSVVNPYIQIAEDNKFCDYTHHRLLDIWRYFRHTWSTKYSKPPGRFLQIIIRDKSQPSHPVIGIAAIGCPVMQISVRDNWIGWDTESIINRSIKNPTVETGIWISKMITSALSEIYLDDFYTEGLLTPSDIDDPTIEIIDRLINYSLECKTKHNFGGSVSGSSWKSFAETYLYKSKRSDVLSDMLRAKIVVKKYFKNNPSPETVKEFILSRDGSEVFKQILRIVKYNRIGIAMAEIIVCGAVDPYGPILGGKLVSMLASSPEIVSIYQNKYYNHESVIASSMAGRPIVRPSNIVFLGTTSIFGVGSSQYNRLKMPCSLIGGKPNEYLSYIELGRTSGFGTSHFSLNTVSALVDCMHDTAPSRRTDSIFGDGSRPRLRKINLGLTMLNFPAHKLLQHGRERIVYGVPLARNIKEYLLGIDDAPDYMFNFDNPKSSTDIISSWWRERWLDRRIESDDVLNSVGRSV
jgi:hypothetical protein